MENQKTKLRRGSVVYDYLKPKEKVKVLTKPYSGELPDTLADSLKTDKIPTFERYCLVSYVDDRINEKESSAMFSTLTYLNKKCFVRDINTLLIRNNML